MAMSFIQIQKIDIYSFLWIQDKFKHKEKLPLVRIISRSGDGWLYAILVFTLLFLDYTKHFSFFVSCLSAFAIEVPLYIYLKNKFKRSRPQQYLTEFEARITASDEFSFPSGHTAAAFVMVVQVMIYFPEYSWYVFSYATAIGISRVLLGVHFPSDIIAGSVVGTLCGFSSLLLFIY